MNLKCVYTRSARRKSNVLCNANGLFTGVLATLSVLVVRISLLEYSKIHEKAYKCIVCEFGGFQNVLRDASVRAIPT